MSGHSKWATIKRKKGKLDAERGKVFTRLIKEITIAARDGGDPDGNPRLRTAIAAAKAANMPQDNIKRAVLKGSGQLPGVVYESLTYEGYGPAGVAVYMEVMTDNRNRTVGEVRHILSKYGGSLGTNGSVAWMFEKKGIINIETSVADEDTVAEVAIEHGAEDVKTEGEMHEIVCGPDDFEAVRQAFEEKSIEMASAEITMIAQNSVTLETEKEATALMKIVDLLEENDDVQKVYTNFDLSDEVMAAMA